MQLITIFLSALLALTVNAAPQGAAGSTPDAATIVSLTPDFEVTAGQQPDGRGDCVTPLSPNKINCNCPPPRDRYLARLIAEVQQGNSFGLPTPFPTGSDTESQIVRFQTMLTVLQNINGEKGKGCPAISSTYKKKLDVLVNS